MGLLETARALVPPSSLHKEAPYSALFTQSKLCPTTQRGVLNHTVSLLPSEMYPSSKTLSSVQTETTTVCSLLTVIPHQADPSPTSQSQCSISHKAESLSTKHFPTSDSFHGQQPFPGCANSQTPMGAKTQRVYNPEKN